MNGTFLVNTTCVVKKLIANCIVYFFDVTPSFGQSWLIFMMKNHNIIIEEFVFTILGTGGNGSQRSNPHIFSARPRVADSGSPLIVGIGDCQVIILKLDRGP